MQKSSRKNRSNLKKEIEQRKYLQYASTIISNLKYKDGISNVIVDRINAKLKKKDHVANFYSLLAYVASSYPIDSYLEVGCRTGVSANVVTYLAEKYLNIFFAVDSWSGSCAGFPNTLDLFLQNMTHYEGNLYLYQEISQTALPKINNTFDLITIDGDHSEQGAYLDLIMSFPKLRKGGFLVFDDLTHHPYLVKSLRRALVEHREIYIEYINFAPSVRGGVALLQRR